MRFLTKSQIIHYSLHLSSKVSQWNATGSFMIAGLRFNRVVMDADWTFLYLKRALLFVSRLVSNRRAVVLFVCGVSKYYVSLNRYAVFCSQPYYGSRYVGGSFSNFFNVKRKVKSLMHLGFLPSVVLVFNPKTYSGLITEAIKLNIPVVSVFSVEMNLASVTYPVPCSFSKVSLSFIANLFSRSIVAARLSESKFLFPVDSYVFRSSYSFAAQKLKLKRQRFQTKKVFSQTLKKKIKKSRGQIFFSASLRFFYKSFRNRKKMTILRCFFNREKKRIIRKRRKA